MKRYPCNIYLAMIEKLCMAMINETLSRVCMAIISDNDKWSFIPVIYCNDKVFSIPMINEPYACCVWQLKIIEETNNSESLAYIKTKV